MPYVPVPFDSYNISYASKSSSSSAPLFAAQIACRIEQSVPVARLFFIKDSESMPPNKMFGGVPHLHFFLSQFDDVTTILRYEKPCVVWFSSDTFDGALSSGDWEPVGEQEGV